MSDSKTGSFARALFFSPNGGGDALSVPKLSIGVGALLSLGIGLGAALGASQKSSVDAVQDTRLEAVERVVEALGRRIDQNHSEIMAELRAIRGAK